MNLNAIAQHLTAMQPKLKAGRNLFIGEMPAVCKDGVLLMPPYHGAPIDHELRGLITTEFAYVVRAVDYDAGNALARDLITRLTVYGDTQIAGGTVLVKQMLPLNEPRPYRRSVGGYWEFEVDVSIRYVDVPA